MKTKLVSSLSSFTQNENESKELSEVFDAYKYYLMYGAKVETTLWTNRQLELYRILLQDEQGSENDIVT
jgi:hypothetical protein